VISLFRKSGIRAFPYASDGSGEWFDSLTISIYFYRKDFVVLTSPQKIVADIDADRNVFLYGRLPGKASLIFFGGKEAVFCPLWPPAGTLSCFP